MTDGQEKLPVIAGVNNIPLSQANKAEDINNVGLTYETSKLLGFSSWEDILENNGGSHHVPFQPSFPETQPSNMGINSNSSQGDEIMGQYLNGSLTQAEGNWQVLVKLYGKEICFILILVCLVALDRNCVCK